MPNVGGLDVSIFRMYLDRGRGRAKFVNVETESYRNIYLNSRRLNLVGITQ